MPPSNRHLHQQPHTHTLALYTKTDLPDSEKQMSQINEKRIVAGFHTCIYSISNSCYSFAGMCLRVCVCVCECVLVLFDLFLFDQSASSIHGDDPLLSFRCIVCLPFFMISFHHQQPQLWHSLLIISNLFVVLHLVVPFSCLVIIFFCLSPLPPSSSLPLLLSCRFFGPSISCRDRSHHHYWSPLYSFL